MSLHIGYPLQLTLLGVCAESMTVPRSVQDKSSQKVISALSKINDAFIRALQNDKPPCSSATPAPSAEDVVAFMNQTARNVLNETKKEALNSE